MSLVGNERTKLIAYLLNTVAAAFLVAGASHAASFSTTGCSRFMACARS